ncbi:MAG: CDP-alcohol phosphatidyltransferase family protein [Nitrospirae bacterium]|nr:CDP-alcohol phosphatidyltransferase family protein [Nitrospirota bacterium]MBI3352114.1 CDP-alcohol phosphatidyltransferase family protein [Nitrospirota bacterium]
MMNVPNFLTLLRILLIPFFINCLIYKYYSLALGILFFAFATDGLDGLIARLADQRTLLGTYLDPMADKLLLTASFVTLSVTKIVPVWASVTVVSRDIVLIFGTILMDMVQMKVNITPTLAGKSSTVLQFLYLCLVLLFVIFNKNLNSLFPLLVVTLALTVGSGLQYLYRGFLK